MIRACLSFVCLMASANASVHSVTLNWTQSNSSNIVCNKVYCGRVSGGPYPWHRTTQHLETTMTMKKVNSGTYYCMVTAIDSQGIESTASNEVEVLVP